MSESWIDRLFLRMGAIFDHAWHSKFPPSLLALAKDEWAEALGEFDGQTIMLVLDYLRGKKNDFGYAPNLSQFLALCKMYKGSRFIEPVALKQGAEPMWDENGNRILSDAAQAAIAELRQKFGLKPKT